MLPYIYIVICLNISYFVGVLLHLFINFIPFAHGFPTVGPQVPRWAHNVPTVGPHFGSSHFTLIGYLKVRWFHPPFSLVPAVGPRWAHSMYKFRGTAIFKRELT